MTDIFSDLMNTGFVDEEPVDPDIEVSLGLVVSLPAERGQDLNIEEQWFLAENPGESPFVIFTETDDDGEKEIFGNQKEFAEAMGRLAPTEAEAIAWSNLLSGARLAQMGWDPSRC
jgi:hypothetical protein